MIAQAKISPTNVIFPLIYVCVIPSHSEIASYTCYRSLYPFQIETDNEAIFHRYTYFAFDMIGAWRQRQEGWWRSVAFCWIYILIMPKTSSYIIILRLVSSSLSYDIYMISLSSVLLLPPLQQLNVLFRSFRLLKTNSCESNGSEHQQQ